MLTAARAALTGHYAPELGEPFVTAGMCLYRDGRDSVAWHGDTIGRSAHTDTMVAIVSFGAPRRCCCARAAAATSLRFPLGHGDLIVMGGSCQRTWEHAIPKTARPVGPRVSVQFRPAQRRLTLGLQARGFVAAFIDAPGRAGSMAIGRRTAR